MLRKCYKCHKLGHFARYCSSGGGYRGDFRSSSRVSFYNCGRSGHFARKCRVSYKTFYTCGKAGHISRECNQDDRKVNCYQCGKSGHLSRDCLEKEIIENATHVAIPATLADISLLVKMLQKMIVPFATVITKKDTLLTIAVQTDLMKYFSPG
ncbi:hypothetical protein NPIL_543791 [Nephila pilipes]|uniref:CCHC-type domain-containing protein n=1 Tax=Nephila pilipes TaxID=299642 RepID=A0A8X6T9W4_NEPPI|nr:hypothetical protein NPIL_543791 [Nephila pilipes]